MIPHCQFGVKIWDQLILQSKRNKNISEALTRIDRATGWDRIMTESSFTQIWFSSVMPGNPFAFRRICNLLRIYFLKCIHRLNTTEKISLSKSSIFNIKRGARPNKHNSRLLTDNSTLLGTSFVFLAFTISKNAIWQEFKYEKVFAPRWLFLNCFVLLQLIRASCATATAVYNIGCVQYSTPHKTSSTVWWLLLLSFKNERKMDFTPSFLLLSISS